MSSKPLNGSSLPADPAGKMTIGTLTYTKAGLVSIFAWLLWGDFVYTLHDHVIAKVIPLALKQYEAKMFIVGLLMTTIPGLLNMSTNPIISTISDRTRTRWGRRIPYLAFTAPINGVVMILLGFSQQIGAYLANMTGWAAGATIAVCIAVCYLTWYITDMFVSAVYYYLFNDVVPRAYLTRFMALYQMIGMITNAAFDFFFLQYAVSHFREIFLVVGSMYLVGYTMMCLKIKEGQYPPPPATMERGDSIFKLAKTYFKECFFHRFYWFFFLSNGAFNAMRAMIIFDVFLYRDSLGLTLSQYGKIGGLSKLIAAVLMFPCGILADKMHPLRFMLMTAVLQVAWGVVMCNWLFWNPDARTAFYVYIVLLAVTMPLNIMRKAATLPMFMQLLPAERYGQFCAANAMVMSLLSMVMGAIAGGFIDVMNHIYAPTRGPDFGYRFIPVWSLFFMAVSALFMYLLYREWKKLGGMDHYKAPDAGDFHSKETEEAPAA
jgi:MFS family permease